MQATWLEFQQMVCRQLREPQLLCCDSPDAPLVHNCKCDHAPCIDSVNLQQDTGAWAADGLRACEGAVVGCSRRRCSPTVLGGPGKGRTRRLSPSIALRCSQRSFNWPTAAVIGQAFQSKCIITDVEDLAACGKQRILCLPYLQGMSEAD